MTSNPDNNNSSSNTTNNNNNNNSASSDKPTPNAAPPPQKRDDFFDHIRRFTDHHIASVLHALTGLPTMLPPSSTWIMDDESQQTTASNTTSPTDAQANPTAKGSSSIIAATEAIKIDKSLPPQSQSNRGRMAECFLLTTTTPVNSLFRPEEEERLAAMWRQVSLLHRDFAAPFFGGDVFGTGMGKGLGMWQDPFLIAPLFWSVGSNRRTTGGEAAIIGEEEVHEQTETDAYNHLASTTTSSTFFSSSSASSPQQPTGDPNKPQVIATVATTHSYTSPDGVTRTKYVLKKRFADGSEEKLEEDQTSAPPHQRITEK